MVEDRKRSAAGATPRPARSCAGCPMSATIGDGSRQEGLRPEERTAGDGNEVLIGAVRPRTAQTPPPSPGVFVDTLLGWQTAIRRNQRTVSPGRQGPKVMLAALLIVGLETTPVGQWNENGRHD